MNNLMECRVKYDKVDQVSGKQKKITETYLLDAVNFTEAEERINKEMEQYLSGEFMVVGVKNAPYSEVIDAQGGDRYYKSKITFVTLDENSGKEKLTPTHVLVTANNVREAYDNVQEAFADTTCDYNICSVSESNVLDFFKYELAEKAEELDGKSKAYKEV